MNLVVLSFQPICFLAESCAQVFLDETLFSAVYLRKGQKCIGLLQDYTFFIFEQL